MGGSAEKLSGSGYVSGIVGYVGGPSNGTVTFSSISMSSSGTQTVQIRYVNGDSAQRYCYVSVNGGSPKLLAFLGTPSNTLETSVLISNFNSGSNTVELYAYDGGYC